jgi:hypothetical protein
MACVIQHSMQALSSYQLEEFNMHNCTASPDPLRQCLVVTCLPMKMATSGNAMQPSAEFQ